MWEITFVFNSITVSTTDDVDNADSKSEAVDIGTDILNEYGLDGNRAQEILINGEEFIE